MKSLSDIAEYLENFFDERGVDPQGIFYSSLKKDTMSAWKKSDFTSTELTTVIRNRKEMNFSEFMNYENSNMVQGTYLSAMCLKYAATGYESALENARKAFRSISKVYYFSQDIAPGFFCKPWGGKATDETSSDQYIYTMTGLDDYYPYAAESEKNEIRDMIVNMARFWLDRNYKWKYYGEEIHWRENRFISFMALACKYSNDSCFQKELNRLRSLQENDSSTPFESTIKEGLFNDGLAISITPENSLSTFLSIQADLRNYHCDRYLEICRDSRQYGIQGIVGDGTVYGHLIRETKESPWEELDKEKSYYIRNQKLSPIFGLHAPYRKGGMQCTMFTRFLLSVDDFIQEPTHLSFAGELLRQVGLEHLTWFEDPNHIFPDEIRWMTHVFSCDAAAHWLWSYWKMQLKYK